MRRPKKQYGFTIPELLIVMSVIGILIGLIITFTVSFSRFAASLQVVSDSFVDRLNLSDYIRDKVGSSSGLIIQTSITDNNPLNPDTSITPQVFWTKLHAVPSTITMPSNGATTPILYFKKFSQDTSGAYIYNGVNPYEDEFVLYLNGTDKSLYIRTLANQSAANNKLKTTCLPANASANCPADGKIMPNVSSVETRYFSRSGTIIDWTSAYDIDLGTYIGPDFPSVEVVELKVNSTIQAKYQTNNLNPATLIRIAIRNT